MRLQDKVVLITGSAGGMGKAAAELFAREGASIIVTDVLADEGEETARGIREAGGTPLEFNTIAVSDGHAQNLRWCEDE